MPQIAPWIVPATLAFAAAGAVLVLWIALRPARRGPKAARKSGKTVQMTCSVCQKDLVFHRNELVALSATECALVARTRPHSVGSDLAEHVCPHCEASHCFELHARRIEWLGANLYSPQTSSTRCMECRRPLRTPPWPPGAYDGRIPETPSLMPEFGLVCERCKAVCCVECCSKATRNRTKNGTYHCPRCSRPDVKMVFHPR